MALFKCGTVTFLNRRFRGVDAGNCSPDRARHSNVKAQVAYARTLFATLLFDHVHYHLLSTMPPCKKLKTAHFQEGQTTPTSRITRASKAANVVIAVASDVQPLTIASVAPSAAKLRRGCLKEIPNFAVEIQLMVCMPDTHHVSETSNRDEVRPSETYTRGIFSISPVPLECTTSFPSS